MSLSSYFWPSRSGTSENVSIVNRDISQSQVSLGGPQYLGFTTWSTEE